MLDTSGELESSLYALDENDEEQLVGRLTGWVPSTCALPDGDGYCTLGGQGLLKATITDPAKLALFNGVGGTVRLVSRNDAGLGYSVTKGSASLLDYFYPSARDDTSGTITYVASVPEPAAWATFTLGFGAIGAAARRRRRVTVRFA